MNRTFRLGIRIISALIGIGLLAYALLAFVVAPSLKPGQQIAFFESSSPKPMPQPNLLPKGEGDLLLVGELRKAGRPVPNARLVFLFQDLFRSGQISTDADGRFEFRLPPGTWRFSGPLIVGSEAAEISYTFTPAIATPTPTFHVGAGSPDRTMYIRVIDGRAAPGDL